MDKKRAARNGVAAAALLVAQLAAIIAPALSAEGVPADEQPPSTIIDEGHERATDAVQRLGAWLDQLFADENYEAEVNESWARLRLESFSQLYDGTEIDGTARVYLKVPSINKRLRFEILSPGEADDLEGADSRETGAEDPTSTRENTSAAVSYLLRALKERSIIFRLGLDFDGYTPDPYAGVRYRETVPLGEEWNLRFVERIRFYSINGLESRTSLDFERGFDQDMLFRASIDGVWLEEEPGYFYSTGFALFRPLDERSAVEYQWVNSFRTDPNRLDNVTLRIRHRQKIWRDWLIMEAAPQLTFPEYRNYEPVPAILFRLEAVFR